MILHLPRICFPAVLAIVMLAPVAHARVFMGSGSTPLAEVSEEIGLKQMYRTEYKINGSDAVLEVYGGNMSPAVAASRLEAGLRARQYNATIPGSDNGAMGVLTSKDELTRMMVTPTREGKTLLFAVRQRWEDVSRFMAAANGRVPDPALPNIPSIPGGRLIYHIEDQKTRTTIAMYRAGSSPEDARQFYARSLPPEGWEPMGVGVGARSIPSMFRRGPLTCMVSARADEKTGEVIVTLLIRRSSL